MNHCSLRRGHVLGVTLLLLGFGLPPANAVHVPVPGSYISGSYEVVQKTDLGSRTRILLRLHLTNRGEGILYLQKILLWDFGQSPAGAPRRSLLVLHAGTSEDTTQEFTIPCSQVEQWQKGLRPRIVLELQTATGARVTQAIRLVPTAGKGE